MFTWSLGWTAGGPAASSSSCRARAAITSLAFMLVDVPEPVWNTSTGKWLSHRPSATSRAAALMAAAGSGGRRPSAALASAAASLMSPSARMKGRGKRRPLTGKLSTARWVWAP